ncbi:MAG TPA: hypothetical protein V6C76_12805 [Drouetiella sp.]
MEKNYQYLLRFTSQAFSETSSRWCHSEDDAQSGKAEAPSIFPAQSFVKPAIDLDQTDCPGTNSD